MAPPAQPPPRARRLGRFVVFGVFAGLLAHLVGIVLTSILLTLYGKPPTSAGEHLSAAQRDWCLRSLVTLRDELEHEVQVALRQPQRRDPRPRFDAWSVTWSARLRDATGRCPDDGGFAKAYTGLLALHDAYVAAVASLLEARSDIAPSLSDVVRLLESERAAAP